MARRRPDRLRPWSALAVVVVCVAGALAACGSSDGSGASAPSADGGGSTSGPSGSSTTREPEAEDPAVVPTSAEIGTTAYYAGVTVTVERISTTPPAQAGAEVDVRVDTKVQAPATMLSNPFFTGTALLTDGAQQVAKTWSTDGQAGLAVGDEKELGYLFRVAPDDLPPLQDLVFVLGEAGEAPASVPIDPSDTEHRVTNEAVVTEVSGHLDVDVDSIDLTAVTVTTWADFGYEAKTGYVYVWTELTGCKHTELGNGTFQAQLRLPDGSTVAAETGWATKPTPGSWAGFRPCPATSSGVWYFQIPADQAHGDLVLVQQTNEAKGDLPFTLP